MRCKKTLFTVVTIVLLFLLCSCTSGGINLNIKVSPEDKSLPELASKTYDNLQLSEIVEYDGPMGGLNDQFPIECLRENEGIYRVSYLGDNNIAVILFDNSGNKILAGVHEASLLKSDFSSLKIGKLLKNVRQIDPNGEYLFLYAGRNDIPRVSTHYTKDGYLILIEYDASNSIISVEYELI